LHCPSWHHHQLSPLVHCPHLVSIPCGEFLKLETSKLQTTIDVCEVEVHKILWLSVWLQFVGTIWVVDCSWYSGATCLMLVLSTQGKDFCV
jgi:hypothetical protein